MREREREREREGERLSLIYVPQNRYGPNDKIMRLKSVIAALRFNLWLQLCAPLRAHAILNHILHLFLSLCFSLLKGNENLPHIVVSSACQHALSLYFHWLVVFKYPRSANLACNEKFETPQAI